MKKNKGNRAEQQKRYRAKYPEKAREAQRRWRAKNKAKARWDFLQYSNRKRSALGSHTFNEWIIVKDIYGNCCAKCQSPERITQDHKIPLSKGGTNNIDNLQPLCHSCNSRKGATVWFASCAL